MTRSLGSESLVFRVTSVLSASESERATRSPIRLAAGNMAVTHLLSVDAINDPAGACWGARDALYATISAPRAFLARAVVAYPDDEAVFAAITAPISIHSAHLAETALPPGRSHTQMCAHRHRANAAVEGRMRRAHCWLADVAYPAGARWMAAREHRDHQHVLRGAPLPEGARTVQPASCPAASRWACRDAGGAGGAGAGTAMLTGGGAHEPERTARWRRWQSATCSSSSPDRRAHRPGYDGLHVAGTGSGCACWWSLPAWRSAMRPFAYWTPATNSSRASSNSGALTTAGGGVLPVLAALRFGTTLLRRCRASIYLFVAHLWGGSRSRPWARC